MRKSLSALLGACLLFAVQYTAQAQLSTCSITATAYATNGSLRPGVVFTVVRVVKSGAVISAGPTSYTTNASGVAAIVLPRSATAWIYADFYPFNTNGTAGFAVSVPATPAANLSDLAYLATTLTTLGQVLYAGTNGVPAALAPNTSATPKFFGEVGTGSIGAPPAWWTLASGGGTSISYDTLTNTVTISSSGGGGSGTVTSVSAGNLTPLFTTSVANSTSTPALTFSLSNASANTIFGNNSGSTNAPAYNAASSYADAVTGLSSTGLVKRTGTNTYGIGVSGTDYEAPLTFSTGLTRSTNTVTVNTSQNIATLSNLTSNGFVKTSGGTGALSVDTNTYLTGNQTITLSGDVSGSGATSITTTVTKINGTSLAGLATGLLKNTTSTGVPSIAAASDVYGLWSGSCSSSTFLRGDGSCATPTGSGDVSSNTATSVDNEVALFNSTTGKSIKRATGSGYAKLTSGVLGTQATIPITDGGTGQTSATAAFDALSPMTTLGDVIYGGASGTRTRLAGNTTTTRKFLRQTGDGTNSAAPAWDTLTAADITGSALTKSDDTNVTLTLGGSPTTALLNAASIAVGWTGTLAKARQNSATVYNDAGNTYSTGAQDFSSASSLKVPSSAGAAPTTSGLIAYDTTSNTLEYGENGTNRIVANLDGTQTLSNKTLTTPTIASFTNATHNHQNAAGGGTLDGAAIASGTLADARLSSNVFYVDGTRAAVSTATSADGFTFTANSVNTGDHTMWNATGLTSGSLLRAAIPTSGFTGRIIDVRDNAGTPADKFVVDSTGKITTGSADAGLITSGTVALARLSGITTSQLSATAGITNAQLANSSITLNAGTNFGITAPGAMSLGSTYTIGATTDNLRFNGLGLGVAAPTNGGQIAMTFGANNITGLLMKRNTDTSPTGKFFDAQNAAGTSVASLDISGNLTVASCTGCGAGGSGYATIQEEGSSLTQRVTLNFIGSGVTAADNSGSSRTDVTIHTAGASQEGTVSTSAQTFGGAKTFNGTLISAGGRKVTRTASASTSFSVAASGELIAFTSTSAAQTATLPDGATAGQGAIYTFIDEGNAAASFNKTISRAGSDTFTDGSTSVILDCNGCSIRVVWTGATWKIF